jgi:hypothetical protein
MPGTETPARLAVAGKAMRGAAGDDGLVPYLLAAATQRSGIVLAERLIGQKSNEVPSSGRCCAS